MEAQIDPLTGGIIWVKQDDQETELKQLKQRISDIQKQPTLTSNNNINAAFNPIPSKLNLDERYNLILSFAHECIQQDELYELLKRKKNPIAYDGFEPSGRMHIAQGILRAINVNKLVDAGVIFIFWVADWFAMLNNKMGGDLQKIRNVGRYFIEVWKAAGMKMHNVKFLWASDEINNNANDYWLQVMDIARKNSLTRIKKCSQIMGRSESDDQPVAQMFYPCMQCTDIFFLKCDICSLGLDQRKVNMLAREYCDSANIKQKPIIISHYMLPGLKEGQEKMSKSDLGSAIFMEDSEEEVKKKIKSAYCKEKQVENNPVLEYTKFMIFEARGELLIERDPKYNVPNKLYKSYLELEEDFKQGIVHPLDLKAAVAKALNELIEPVRKHFKEDPTAKQLLQEISTYKVTK